MNKRQYFGTDGIRGRVGSEIMNPEFMMRLGFAAGSVLTKNNAATVLIGHDTRLSCDMLESALQCGLSAAGVNVQLVGVLPTPAIAYLTRSLQASAGIVISASHNSYQDNGIKFFNQQGMKLSDDFELAIEDALPTSIDQLVLDSLGKVECLMDAARRYIDFCKSIFLSQLSLKDLKIVLDCANGATYDVAPRIFQELNAELITIHNTPNGKNINDHCGATDVESLQIAVNKYKADLGLAFDGDGDRLILVDHHGEIVDGDEILCILAKYRDNTTTNSKSNQHRGIVGTVMSNLGLEQALTADGIAFERTPVGDRYVLEALIDKGWTLGGEASGHIVDLNYTTTGDGIVTGLQVLRVICKTKKTLHALKKTMVKRPQVLINVPIKEKIDLTANKNIQQAVLKVESELKDQGRVLLRPSGTEPLIRVMVEGNDQCKVKNAAESIATAVQKSISKEEIS